MSVLDAQLNHTTHLHAQYLSVFFLQDKKFGKIYTKFDIYTKIYNFPTKIVHTTKLIIFAFNLKFLNMSADSAMQKAWMMKSRGPKA